MTIKDGHSRNFFEHRAKNKFISSENIMFVRTIELQNTQRIPIKFGIVV
jgi:hypothetical protein